MSTIPSGSLPGGDVPFKLFKRLQFHKGVNAQTMTGHLTASFSSAQIQVLDPDGSDYDVVLPSCSGSAGEGSFFLVKNNAGAADELIDLVDEADQTVVQLAGGESALVIGDSDGTWHDILISGSI